MRSPLRGQFWGTLKIKKTRPRFGAALVDLETDWDGLELAAVDGVFAEQLLDAEELIVFGDAVGAAQGTGLDLASIGSHRDVGNGGVFGLTGAMADDGGVGVFLGQFDGVQ